MAGQLSAHQSALISLNTLPVLPTSPLLALVKTYSSPSASCPRATMNAPILPLAGDVNSKGASDIWPGSDEHDAIRQTKIARPISENVTSLQLAQRFAAINVAASNADAARFRIVAPAVDVFVFENRIDERFSVRPSFRSFFRG